MRRRSLASSILSGSLWEKFSSWSNRVQRFCSFIRSPDLSCFPTETQCTPPGKQTGEEKNNKFKAFEQLSSFERGGKICSNLQSHHIFKLLLTQSIYVACRVIIELYSPSLRKVEDVKKLKYGVNLLLTSKILPNKISQSLSYVINDHCTTVSQRKHSAHFGPDNSLLWGTVLCIIGCLTASLASIH